MQIHAQGGYTFRGNEFQQPDGIASAAVGLSWNLFDAGRSQFRADAIRDRARAVWQLLQDEQSRVELEVRQAYLDVMQTRERLQVTEAAIERADENLRVNRIRYQSGLATNTDVLEAVNLQMRTRRNNFNALYDAVLAQLHLERVIGQS